jgi:uncharacterized protein (TIGR00661 family)
MLHDKKCRLRNNNHLAVGEHGGDGVRVCYGLVGMTRGHAARALAIGQELIDRGHEVLFCTEGDAEELLSARFGSERLYKMTTPRYYQIRGKLSIAKTGIMNSRFLLRRGAMAKPLIEHLREWKPDVAISDYEPLMWKVAKKLKIPFVAVNSQEFLVSSPLPKGLSLSHRIQAKAGGMIVRRFAPSADLRLVGKILVRKKPKSPATFVGAILRKEFDQLKWQPQGTHFLVYTCPMLQGTLKEINELAIREQRRAKVFGADKETLEGLDWLDHQPTSEAGFIEALRHADFAVATPGNQFLAEALHLGVPVLMTPTPNQFEQEITALIQEQERPQQYRMFTAEQAIPDASFVNPVDAETSGRSKTVDMLERLMNLNSD